MNNTSKHITGPDKLVSPDGRVFRPCHKELLESLPADIARELARRRMEEIEAAYPGTFPELRFEDAPSGDGGRCGGEG